MARRTQVLSVHKFRRVARAREREIQKALAGEHPKVTFDLPPWTLGVRVEKAGRFQWAVVATEYAGH